MVLTAAVSVLFAICVCLLAVRKTFAVLCLDPLETLVWLGLAEQPVSAAYRTSGANPAARA